MTKPKQTCSRHESAGFATCIRPVQSTAQQEKSDDCQTHAEQALPRSRFAEKQNPGDRHDGGAAGENRGNGREWSAFLKEEEKRDRARADANSGEHRVIETRHAEFLVPAPA